MTEVIPLITIEGATASGKSDLAVTLAKALNTEIISADSRQVYKYLNIGTAKPDKHTQNEIKHHLIDIITPNQRYSAGSFVKDSQNIIQNIYKSDKIPIVCGGTMLYIKSLLYGLSPIPDSTPEAIQKTIEFINEHSWKQCYEFVRRIDEKFANSIAPTDKQRISRAIEVWMTHQKSLTEFWETTPKETMKIKPYKIYVHQERDVLYHRINQRTHEMIRNGLLNEIIDVLEMGYNPTDYGLNTVGYKEFLIETKDLLNAIEKAKQHTRNYAKRQITWYKKENFDCVFTEEQDINTLIEEIKKTLDKNTEF